MDLIPFIGACVVLCGSIFLFLAALGLLRMPDLYTRMQAGTKATTLGTLLTVAGLVFIVPDSWSKLLLLGIFVLITNPVSSHALTRSAHFQNIDPLDLKLKGHILTGKDALAEKKQGNEEDVT